MYTRREMLRAGAAISMGFLGLRQWLASGGRVDVLEDAGFGPLTPDPHGVLDLPAGFSYRIFSKQGERMDDGLFVPGLHDGMATFPDPDGLTILVRNHEVHRHGPRYGAFGWQNELLGTVDRSKVYDAGFGRDPSLGATTTLVYDTHRQELRQHSLSLAGTNYNCAGGPTPWGSWISCEETQQTADAEHEHDHGFAFEVPATTKIALADPVPIKAMGRFKHEAIAVEPASGVIYQTEDIGDGLFYRFIPHEPSQLLKGGRLQALSVTDQPSLDTRNWPEPDEEGNRVGPATVRVRPGERLPVRWIDLDEVESPEGDLRLRGFESGAAKFSRGEGLWFGRDAAFFACTDGGPAQRGQIWRYTPSPHEGTDDETTQPGELELFIESEDDSILRNCDNVTVSPWGDLIVTEDGRGPDKIVGITPEGEMYLLAVNKLSSSELAGATFSPDGSTLFFNIQNEGVTVAVTGPWDRAGRTGM